MYALIDLAERGIAQLIAASRQALGDLLDGESL